MAVRVERVDLDEILGKIILNPAARTQALRAGEVKSDLVKIEFTGPKVANQGFKPMVREGKFDGGELAIVTFLQALEYGKPLVLMPATISLLSTIIS